MARFRLKPEQSAVENMWEAARVAAVTLLRKHKWYGFHDALRDQLYDEVLLATVTHFITYKVRAHKYNRAYTFAQNMISSAWSVTGTVANDFIKRFDREMNAVDVDIIKYSLKQEDVPLYASIKDTPSKRPRPRKAAHNKAFDVRDEYADYLLECEYMGVEAQPWETWLVSTGYSKDPAIMWYLEDDIQYRNVVAKQVKRQWHMPEGLEFLRRDGRKK